MRKNWGLEPERTILSRFRTAQAHCENARASPLSAGIMLSPVSQGKPHRLCVWTQLAMRRSIVTPTALSAKMMNRRICPRQCVFAALTREVKIGAPFFLVASPQIGPTIIIRRNKLAKARIIG